MASVSLPPQLHSLRSAWHDCFPPINFLSFLLWCVLSCLLPSCCLSAIFHTLPTILSVPTSLFLCGCGPVMFYIWFCLVVKKHPVALILVHVLYLTLALFPHSHTLQNKQTSIIWHIPQLRFNLRIEVERCLNYVFEWKWYCLYKQDVFLSLCVHTSVPLTLTHTAACKKTKRPW